MVKKSDYSLFINFFFKSLKKLDYSLIFRPSLFTIHYFWANYSLFIIKKGPLFTNHYTPSRPGHPHGKAQFSQIFLGGGGWGGGGGGQIAASFRLSPVR